MKGINMFLSVIMAIMILVSIVPITASAATSGTCGENLTWTFNSKDGTLSLTGHGSMNKYVQSEIPWSNILNEIKSIRIEEGVTDISDDAFNNCTFLETVFFPASLKSIGYFAFMNCNSIREIIIPDNVEYIGSHAFASCDSLRRVVIGNAVSEIMRCTFEGCEQLEKVSLPKSLIRIDDSAFYRCLSLKEVLFDGDNDEWNKIQIGMFNDSLMSAKLIYLSNIKIIISEPSVKQIRYKDGIILHSDILGEYPTGSYIIWSSDNKNFKESITEESLLIIAASNGKTVFTVTLIDEYGNELAQDSVEMYSKAGFFDKIGGFFRSLFGTTKIYKN